MSWFTISGTSSGTLDPATGLTVSGGCDTCSGSHYVSYDYPYYIPPASGCESLLIQDNVTTENTVWSYMKGDALGTDPNELRPNLIAWHSLDELGTTFEDKSGNGINGTGYYSLTTITGKYGYGRAVGEEFPPGTIQFSNFPTQQNDYMCSFWLQPTELLTSGNQNYFTLCRSDGFYGARFTDVYDYVTMGQGYKGWTLLNSATTCSAGYSGDLLRFKGKSYTNWFGSSWSASTLYFTIPGSKDWTVETTFYPVGGVVGTQSFGFILFDRYYSYLNYCSFLLQSESYTTGDLIDSSIPAMTSSTTPSPYIVSQSSYYLSSNNYAGWRSFDDIYDANYWHSGDGALPDWVQLDTGIDGNRVIQGYRLRRTNIHFPKDWTFLGSNNGTSWDTLHTMVGQTDPGEGNWSSWFYFSNTTAYRYYRINITKSQSGTGYTCFSRIEFYVKEYSKIPVQNKIMLQTGSSSYAVAEHLPAADVSWDFRARKRKNIINFYYKNSVDSSWTLSDYYMDISNWRGATASGSIAFGLTSYSTGSDSAPEGRINEVKFIDGEKPANFGEPEQAGRLLLTYNKVDISACVEERTDSRLWIQTNRNGFAYGTSTYRWDPNQWYLIQFGFKPNANPSVPDYCWWVNGKQEKGLVVGSGSGASSIITSDPFYYFENDLYPMYKNLFKLDEVSHWSRWLTGEEILKMWHKLSQISWHKTEPVRESSDTFYANMTTVSGDFSEQAVTDNLTFNWSTQYQAPLPEEKLLQMETASYRIQIDLLVHASRVDSKTASIIRYSSGWISTNSNCYCIEAVDPYPISRATLTATSVNPSYPLTNLFDGNSATFFQTNNAPSTAVCAIKFSYPLGHPNPRTYWNAIRFRSYNGTAYLTNYPKDITISGSMLDNPSVSTPSHWGPVYTTVCSAPAAQGGWGGWITFPSPILYTHYLIRFLTNYGNPASNPITLSEMEIETTGLPSFFRDVRVDVPMYIRAYNYPSLNVLFHASNRVVTSTVAIAQPVRDQAQSVYRVVYYDTTGPGFIYVRPQRNERRVSPLLDWDSPTGGRVTVKDYGGAIRYPETKVWINHENQGYNTFTKSDNFCFYSLDFKSLPTVTGVKFVTTSGSDWTFANPQSTRLAYINNEMEFVTSSDYSVTVGSGYHLITTTYTPDDCKEIIRRDSYRFDPVTYAYGTKSLEISTTSGTWLAPGGGVPQAPSISGSFTAPFVYTTIPSGISAWTIETKLFVERDGDERGQYAGLMMTYEDDPSKFYRIVASASGIATQCHLSFWDQSCVTRSGLATDDVWMRITKSESSFSFSWSENSIDWKTLQPQLMNLNPAMSSNSTPSPYRCWASTERNANTPAWKAFDQTCSGTYGYWESGTVWPHYLVFDYVQPTTVYYYQLIYPSPGDQDEQRGPSTFSLQGSHDSFGWSTVDSRLNQYDRMSCGSGIVYQVNNPGTYRYYRLFITASNVGSTLWVRLAELRMWGDFNHQYTKTDSNYRIGPIVISDRSQHTAPFFTTIPPNMTSNSAPSPLVASASLDNANAWRAFSNDGSWAPSANPWTNPYVQIDFGLTVIIQGIRWTNSIYETVMEAALKGSNDLSNWETLFYFNDKWGRSYYNYPGGYTIPNANDFLRFSNYKLFRYYRFYIYKTSGANGTYQRLNNLKFYGGQPANQEITSALTYANFDYVKLTLSSGIENITIGDPWELLLDSKTAIISENNSCATTFTESDSSTHTLTYYPKSSFVHGEPIYMRAQASDVPSFKVDYDPVDSYLLLMISGSPGVPITNRIVGQMYDSSLYGHKVYASYGSDETMVGSYLLTTTGIVYEGQCAIEKNNPLAYLHTQDFPASYFNSNWTIDLWSYNTATPSGNIFGIRRADTGVQQLSAAWTTSGINLTQISTYLTTFRIAAYTLNSWQHFAIVKNNDYVHAYYKGVKLGSVFLPNSGSIITSTSGYINFFSGSTGYTDMLNWRKSANWTTMRSLNYGSKTDEIWMYTPTDWKDLSVDINAVQDTNSPVVIPVGPIPSASGVCPASGIVFDIVDDMSGVYWDSVKIIIGDITVYSGGNNMCDYYSDRGTLTWEERGEKDGEWSGIFITPSGEIYNDGINRQLYPPGTTYSGSGAWGRRFTYNVPSDTQLSYFDKSVVITISGTDSVGYASAWDAIRPNSFQDSYNFDFISNDNINAGNFFLSVGESERIDVLRAQDRLLYVDIWDSNYPETDIIEEESYLHFSDGVNSLVCSGTWFTTYTGAGGLTPSGILVHRLHYDAGDYYWDGHRTMQYTVHVQNNDPLCHVYNEYTYRLLYGWHLFWLHKEEYLPFDFDQKLPVFVSIKTQEYVPSRFSKSYMLWTAPAITHDLGVELKALPLGGGNTLEVDLVAHSHYLQYSENVEVEVSCQDRDGNAMVYTWTFRTEDEPEN